MAVAADEDDWGCGCVSTEDVVRLAVSKVESV